VTFPTRLARWRSKLALFDAEVVRALCPMIAILERAIGPLGGDVEDTLGDPNGYDGVAPRGPYERLLASEWLLASEAPDEFIRRAAHREHLFLALARPSSQRTKVSTVFVDVGPDVFGSPRIALLATLLVLAERAVAAHATFAWATAQGDDAPIEGETPDALAKRLLGAQTHMTVVRDAIAERVARATSVGEVWIVGSARAAQVASDLGISSVRVEDELEASTRALLIDVREPKRAARSARLELPDDRTCVQILRDPFSRATAQRTQASTGALALTRPFVSMIGRRIFARLEGGGVLSLPIPNSPRFDMGKGRVVHASAGADVIAIGASAKAIHTTFITQEGELFALNSVTRAGAATRRVGLALEGARPPPMDGRLFPLLRASVFDEQRRQTHDAWLFRGRCGRLLEFRPGKRTEVIARECRAIAVDGRRLVYADDSSQHTVIHCLDHVTPHRERSDLFSLKEPSDGSVFLGLSQGDVICAFHEPARAWSAAIIKVDAVRRARKPDKPTPSLDDLDEPRAADVVQRRFVLALNAQVVGVALLESTPATTRRSPALVVLGNGSRSIDVWVRKSEPSHRAELPARAVHVEVGGSPPIAACLLETRELVVVGLNDGKIWGRVRGAESAS
jgi:hypothetical protein